MLQEEYGRPRPGNDGRRAGETRTTVPEAARVPNHAADTNRSGQKLQQQPDFNEVKIKLKKAAAVFDKGRKPKPYERDKSQHSGLPTARLPQTDARNFQRAA